METVAAIRASPNSTWWLFANALKYSPARIPILASIGMQLMTAKRALRVACSCGRAPCQSSVTVTGEHNNGVSLRLNWSQRPRTEVSRARELRSRYQSQSKQTSRSDSPEPLPFPKPANMGLRIWQVLPVFPHANQGLHGLPATGGSATVLIADGLTDQFRNTGALLPRPDMQCLPDVLLEVKLSSSHDV